MEFEGEEDENKDKKEGKGKRQRRECELEDLNETAIGNGKEKQWDEKKERNMNTEKKQTKSLR